VLNEVVLNEVVLNEVVLNAMVLESDERGGLHGRNIR
jgi:hypothetical protein